MSDKAQRVVLWTLALLLTVGTGLALRYARGYRPLAGFGGTSLPPRHLGIRFDGIKAVGREGGRRSWVLTAGRMETTPSRTQLLFSDGIRATLFPLKNRPAATLTARSATYDDTRRALQIAGSIVCTVRGLRLLGETVEWDAGSSVVRSPGAVRAVHPRGEVRGEQLTINIRTGEYTLRNIQAEFRVDPSEELPL